MARILSFTKGPDDWQAQLADPDKQWKQGYSARTLAYSWEASDGFPPEICKCFEQPTDPLLEELKPLLAIPEFKVHLPGGSRPSQSDIFVLARSSAGPVCIMVEGKVNESFGPTVDEWRAGASRGKETRLKFLLRTLCLTSFPNGAIRYQLLHRAASAIITAEQYRAIGAVLLVHSFSEGCAGWSDYEAFTLLFGVRAKREVVQRLPSGSSVPLFAAWVLGNPKFLNS